MNNACHMKVTEIFVVDVGVVAFTRLFFPGAFVSQFMFSTSLQAL